MLASLYISNYILIENQEIEFQNGFTVITGETGAGKSILINALNLILGSRPKGDIHRDKNRKAIFEAIFTGLTIPEAFFQEHDLDYDKTLIIRREILPGGKSRLFINDTPVNISVVRELAPQIIDIHSQHQNLLINTPAFRTSIIDTIAGNGQILEQYGKLYKEYGNIINNLNILRNKQKEAQSEKDYIEYRLQLLKNASISENEAEELELKVKELSNFEEIKNVLSGITYTFYDSENAIISEINNAIRNLEHTTGYLNEANEWKERMQSIEIELNDLLNEISAKNDNLTFDPEEFSTIMERYNLINELMRKFNVNSTSELLQEQYALEKKLNEIISYDSQIIELETEAEKLKSELDNLASKLHSSRTKAKPKAEKNIESIIKELGIKNGKLIIDITPTENFTPYGKDEIKILFSANKETTPGPIEKIASGGELSRIMLAIKSVIASGKNIPTIIFDEIDTGVSGEIAAKMGNIMKNIAKNTQVIAITHLPQIAAKGENHLIVEKQETENKTTTAVKYVKGETRIREIAKMISGNKINNAAIENAKSLMD